MSDDEITPDDYRLDATSVGWRAEIVLHGPPVRAFDITRQFRVLYDLAVGSMNFGSGFLDREDAEALQEIAELCDMEMPNYVMGYGEVADSTAERFAREGREVFGHKPGSGS